MIDRSQNNGSYLPYPQFKVSHTDYLLFALLSVRSSKFSCQNKVKNKQWHKILLICRVVIDLFIFFSECTRMRSLLVFLKISWGTIPPDPPAGVGFSACMPFYIVQLWFHHLIKPFLKAYFSSVKGYKGYMHCPSLSLILSAEKRIYYSTIFCWIDFSGSKFQVPIYWQRKQVGPEAWPVENHCFRGQCIE